MQYGVTRGVGVQETNPVYYTRQDSSDPGYYPEEGAQYRKRSSGNDLERSSDNTFAFADKSVRQGFIRKVYSILTVQLMFTLSVVAVFVFCDPVKEFVQKHSWLLMVAFVLFLATYLTLVCCESCRRKTPQNYFCLGLFTMVLSFTTGVTSSRYDTHVVFLAVGITALVTLSLTLFAMQTKVDFTLCSGFLCAATIIVIMLGFAMSMAIFVIGYSRILSIVYASVAALLFSMYLVYDTQLLMGGRRYSLSEEEYILAAIQLYLDIVMLFLYILQLTGFASRD